MFFSVNIISLSNADLSFPTIHSTHNSFSFLIGLVIAAILLSVVDSSVNTVLVSFAEAPMEFQENHPQLSSEMRDAWRKVYPAECGF